MNKMLLIGALLLGQQTFAATETYLNCNFTNTYFRQDVTSILSPSVLASESVKYEVVVPGKEVITLEYSKDSAEPMYANYVISISSNGESVINPLVHQRTEQKLVDSVSSKMGTVISCNITAVHED